jgi:alkaline phosphatase D
MDMKRLMERWQKLLGAEEEQRRKLNRRQFLIESGKWAIASLGVTLVGLGMSAGNSTGESPMFEGYPFTLGVASGDPLPDSVILWTRLAINPLYGGGMKQKVVPVTWEMALDDRFTRPVQQGVEFARPELGHSVHVEVNGLSPNQVYYYRFRAGKEESAVGRTKTLPPYGASVEQLTFAFASCQKYEDGYFTAYKHMSQEPLDLIFHLGDYIYEGASNMMSVRPHVGRKLVTLDQYRNRYAQYRSDTDLRAAHAACPWVVVMDDHEVENNWAGDFPQKDQPIEPFLRRRMAAFQAYYEHMPLRLSSMPSATGMQLYRRFQYGDLASFHVLDTRQYRDDQANGDGWKAPTEQSKHHSRTLLGAEQEAWLLDGLTQSAARWNVMAQQMFLAKRDSDASADAEKLSMDAWDGYPAARDRLLRHVQEQGIQNLVVLTGDVHSNWANEIKEDFGDPASRTLGVEWVGTSISSSGDGTDRDPAAEKIMAGNPHLKFFNKNRGYVKCTVTPALWRTDYQTVPYITRPGAPMKTRATFTVESGKLRLVQSYDGGTW